MNGADAHTRKVTRDSTGMCQRHETLLQLTGGVPAEGAERQLPGGGPSHEQQIDQDDCKVGG